MILLIKSRFGSAGWICITLLRQFVNTAIRHTLETQILASSLYPSRQLSAGYSQIPSALSMDTTWVLPERIPGHPQEDSGPWKTVPDTTAEAGRITEFRVAKVWLCGWILPKGYLKHWLHAGLPLRTWEHLENPARTRCERAAADSLLS